MRSLNGRDHPEAFGDDEVGRTAVRTIQSMQQHAPGQQARGFLVRQVGLTGPEAEAILVHLAAPDVPVPRPDPREGARRMCERLTGLQTVEQWVAEFDRFAAEQRDSPVDPAARTWAQLGAAERGKLLAWANRELRPGMNRMVTDYAAMLRQPGAIDAMRTRICGAADGSAPTR